jgi:hypothetical protein
MLKNIILLVSDIADDFCRESRPPPIPPTSAAKKGLMIAVLIFAVGLVGGMACVGVPLTLKLADYVMKHQLDNDNKPQVVINNGVRPDQADDGAVPAVEESPKAPTIASARTKPRAPGSTRSRHGTPPVTQARMQGRN